MLPTIPLFPEASSALRTARHAALFDLDGTLVRTAIDFPGMRAAMRDLAGRYAPSAAEALAATTDPLAIVDAVVAALDDPATRVDARREAIAIIEGFEEKGCARPQPILGAPQLLQRLRGERAVAVGVVTRNTRRIAQRLLCQMRLPYDVLIAREDTPRFKPHPEPVVRACLSLDTSPLHAVMIGDFWTDIAAGRAAGVRATIGICWPSAEDRFQRCPPDFAVTSLEAAAALLLGEE
jgi:beta-phosphoglucomutase-like phosphatase (HAD superfamily)